MPEQAPTFSGPDLLGGPAFDLADHKSSFVFVEFMGLPWCGPCKLGLPHLQALADMYAADPSTPSVDFVIVNSRLGSKLSTVVDYAKQENVNIPILDDENSAILHSYDGSVNTVEVPKSFIVKPGGVLSDKPPKVGWGTAEELLDFLAGCGAPAPGSVGALVVDWSSQPPPVVVINPAFTGFPKDFPVPVRVPPPGPKPLSIMSRAVIGALAIHDAASGIAHHETSIAIRSAALKAAADSLKRMQSAAALASELGPLPPHAVERIDRRKRA